MFVDLLFFNRELNSLVAVELKSGKFRSSYLGQLNTYLSALDVYVKKPHENPSIGIILCRDLNKSFVDKLPGYKVKLEEWMLTEKPYLRKDFKLIDAMKILPLNRSYLSRLFNEGYGESFYHFVMRYRLEESKRLLLSRPDLNITNIAELSGFSSISVFGRAFHQYMNCSPMQWREKQLQEKK